MIINAELEVTHLSLKNVDTAYIQVSGQTKVYPKVENIGGNDANTELLIHSDTNGSTNFVDSSSNTIAITNNTSMVHSIASQKFGDTSLFCDTTNYLTIPSNANLTFGTGDFTIDFWLNPSPNGGVILDNRADQSLGSGRFVFFNQTGNLYSLGDGSGNLTGVSIPIGTWNHIAIVRNNSNTGLYLNGVQQFTNGDSANYDQQTWYIGANNNTGQGFLGYLDEFRVSSTARWTSNFTPPKIPYDTDVTCLYLVDENGNQRTVFC